MERDGHCHWCDDAIERAYVAQELADGVIAADHAELVAVGVELLARKNRHRLHAGEVKSDAASRRRDVLEKSGNLIAPRHQLSHDLETLFVLSGLCPELLQGSLSDVRLRLLISL